MSARSIRRAVVVAAMVAAAALAATRVGAHEGHTTGPHPTPTAAANAAPTGPVPVAFRILPPAR